MYLGLFVLAGYVVVSLCWTRRAASPAARPRAGKQVHSETQRLLLLQHIERLEQQKRSLILPEQGYAPREGREPDEVLAVAAAEEIIRDHARRRGDRV